MSCTRIVHGDCREVLAAMPAASFDAVVCDPPYGLGMMRAGWDQKVPGPDYWREVLRVAKPGAYLLAFGAPRYWHRLAVAIEDSGFEMRDQVLRLFGELDGPLFWLRGDGNPKARRLDRLLESRRHDRAELLEVTAWIAAARDQAGLTNADLDRAFGFAGMAGHWTSSRTQPAIPTLDQVPPLLEVLGLELRQVPPRIAELLVELNGRKGEPGALFGERVVLGTRRVMDTSKTAPAGFRPRGVRKLERREIQDTAPASAQGERWQGHGTKLKPAWEPVVVAMRPLEGTFAANAERWGVAGFNVAAAAVDGGERPAIESRVGPDLTANSYGAGINTGSISRGKTTAPRWPANLVLDQVAAEQLDLEAGDARPSRFFYAGKARGAKRRGAGNDHPTVKPADVMRWLASLVLPPPREDGSPRRLLDPFAGSGTTALGALAAGWDEVVLVEDHRPYFELAARRVREFEPLLHTVDLEGEPCSL